MRINAHRFGLLMAFFLASSQIVWAALVAIGWAQPLVDFIMSAWFFEPTLRIAPFSALHALMLALGVGAIGYIVGWSVGVALNTAQHLPE